MFLKSFCKISHIKLTLLKVTLIHGCFSRFLNCHNGTKLRKASHINTEEDWNVLNEFRNPFLSNVSFWTSLGISENRWFCNICRENQKEVSRKKYISNVLYRSLWKTFTISFCVFPVEFDHVFVLGVSIRKCFVE